MKKGFYSKIALSNIKKNPRLYVPRILAEIGLLGCFYIMFALTIDEEIANVSGGDYLATFMWMGAVILGILSLIIILYVNSFLMKRRKNEYGLYNVLGMEKKHIIKVLFSESFFTFIVADVLGIVFGILFYKLASLLICKLLHVGAVAGFYYINAKTILFPLLIFIVFNLVAFVINSISISRLKPVELLSVSHTGEKEPKVKWAMLIIGVVTLGAGYYISLAVSNPLEAIFLFFAAVLLIIIGTYFLFITGTTFLLKCLKKNKKYYYTKRHMPAVSGLLFRMKQNAVGLASIAVLATGVLIMISTTVSLYSGVEKTLIDMYPDHLYLSAAYEEDDQVKPVPGKDLEIIVRDAAEKNNVEIESINTEKYLYVSYVYENGELKPDTDSVLDMDNIVNVTFVTKEMYDELSSKQIHLYEDFVLNKDEILYAPISGKLDQMIQRPETIKIHGKEYKVKESLNSFPIQNIMNKAVFSMGIVVSDQEVLDEIYQAQQEAYGNNASTYSDRIAVTFADEAAASKAWRDIDRDISDSFQQIPGFLGYTYDCKWNSEEALLGMYGAFMFLGILLGFVCLFSTILIIYYKQISEGYEDRERFQIMQKIGMEEKEVKKTISNQLTLQFLLPLITAGIHTLVMSPILLKLLEILYLYNTQLYIICAIITFAVFAAVYTVVYLLTSRTYYKIVH